MDFSRPARDRVSMSIQPALHLLSHQLRIVSVGKEHLHELTYSLLQLTLKLLGKDTSCRKNHFYSFTETDSEYSLVLDDDLFTELKSSPAFSSVEVASGKWRPLVIEVGAFGSLTGISKIAANVIGPLADENVSVFCLSTNQEDYVMVEESDLNTALQCLCNRFKLVCDSESEHDLQLVEKITPSHIHYTVHSMGVKKLMSQAPRPIIHPFTCSKYKFHVCSVIPSTLPSIAQPLLQMMFFNPRSSEERFFSISIIDDDVSLIVDTRDIYKFPPDSVYTNEAYLKVITIGNGPLGFDECGIVAQVSSPLGEAEISTFYICTFNTDHMLIPEDGITKAVQILNKYLISKHSNKTEPISKCHNNGLSTCGLKPNPVTGRILTPNIVAS